MIVAKAYQDESVGVFGLGRSGLSAARALIAGGANVVAWDDDEDKRVIAKTEGIPLGDLYDDDLAKFAALVLSPGVPLTHPEPHPLVIRAAKANCPVIGDLELFAQTPTEAQVVGITGTNGKSTTTALVAHVLKVCGITAEAGANLGRPVLDLPVLGKGAVYVLELSSYQIELAPTLACDIAVLLNISPDHLDRHGTLARYVRVKKQLFAKQFQSGAAIVSVDDPYSAGVYTEIGETGRISLIPVHVGDVAADGISVEHGILYDRTGPRERSFDLSDVPALRGAHNWQNAAAAYAIALIVGADPAAIGAALQSFAGLAHRMEIADEIDGVLFVNDSKATNAAAASHALAAFDSIYWIAGGQAKNGGITDLVPLFDRVRHAFLIGEAADRFAETMGSDVPHTVARDLETAVTMAQEKAATDKAEAPVVLLSPACASFDQWRDYEERGNTFCDLVHRLPGHHRAPDNEPGNGPGNGEGLA